MRHLALTALRDHHAEGGELFHEFLRVDSLSAGLYMLPAGEPDPQTPHEEDELYVVLAGSASFTAADETILVGPGTTIFVPAHQAHRFHDVTERLEVVVVFAPPESEQ
jgi:mannose-6-phosphate isomerase-like protein (cupin superfamily)